MKLQVSHLKVFQYLTVREFDTMHLICGAGVQFFLASFIIFQENKCLFYFGSFIVMSLLFWGNLGNPTSSHFLRLFNRFITSSFRGSLRVRDPLNTSTVNFSKHCKFAYGTKSVHAQCTVTKKKDWCFSGNNIVNLLLF